MQASAPPAVSDASVNGGGSQDRHLFSDACVACASDTTASSMSSAQCLIAVVFRNLLCRLRLLP